MKGELFTEKKRVHAVSLTTFNYCFRSFTKIGIIMSKIKNYFKMILFFTQSNKSTDIFIYLTKKILQLFVNEYVS